MNDEHAETPPGIRLSDDAARLQQAILSSAAAGSPPLSVAEVAMELGFSTGRVTAALAEIGRAALKSMGVAADKQVIIGVPGAKDLPITLDELMHTLPTFDAEAQRDETHRAELEELAQDPHQSRAVRLGAAAAAGAKLSMHPELMRRLIRHATNTHYKPTTGSGRVAIATNEGMRADHVLATSDLQVPHNSKLALVQLQVTD